jgi:hypothetical protein
MKEVELSSKRKVKIKEMSIDDVDFCSDILEAIYSSSGEVIAVKGLSKTRTAWLRRGIAGGDFKDFSINGRGLVNDSTLKELSESEKSELSSHIQEYQEVGK